MTEYVFWGKFESLFASDQFTAGRWPHVSTSAAAVQHLKTIKGQSPSVLFVRDEELQSDPDGFKQITESHPQLVTVLVYQDSEPQKIMAWLALFSSIDHIMPLNSENSQSLIVKFLATSLEDMRSKFIGPANLQDRHEKVLYNSFDRDAAYLEVSKYAQGLQCFSSFESIIWTVASELLTNAFYNGKRNPKTGAPMFSNRAEKFVLDKGEAVTLTYGHDESYLWVMVQDCFGSLDRKTLVKALTRAATEQRPRTDDTGGAGLGLMMIYGWATELGFFLSPGQSTLVTCKFKLTKRNRLFESEPSALHIFTDEGQDD